MVAEAATSADGWEIGRGNAQAAQTMNLSTVAPPTIPLATLATIVLCCALHAGTYLFGWEVGDFTIAAWPVLYRGEYYRLLTSALFHGGLMHIGPVNFFAEHTLFQILMADPHSC